MMDSSWLQHADPCTARDLTIEAAQSVALSKKLGATPASRTIPFAKLKALLDSRSDRDILDGLRRVISVSRDQPTPLVYSRRPLIP